MVNIWMLLGSFWVPMDDLDDLNTGNLTEVVTIPNNPNSGDRNHG